MKRNYCFEFLGTLNLRGEWSEIVVLNSSGRWIQEENEAKLLFWVPQEFKTIWSEIADLNFSGRWIQKENKAKLMFWVHQDIEFKRRMKRNCGFEFLTTLNLRGEWSEIAVLNSSGRWIQEESGAKILFWFPQDIEFKRRMKRNWCFEFLRNVDSRGEWSENLVFISSGHWI